jgi:serine/threonine protein kinase
MIKIDDLILIKSIGKGSYGEVFLTKKEGSEKQYATKKCAKRLVLQDKIKNILVIKFIYLVILIIQIL